MGDSTVFIYSRLKQIFGHGLHRKKFMILCQGHCIFFFYRTPETLQTLENIIMRKQHNLHLPGMSFKMK